MSLNRASGLQIERTLVLSLSMEYKLTTLPNLLRVLTVEMPNLESAAVTLFVGVGSRYEAKQKSGLSHFLEHIVFKGTPRRPTFLDVSKEIDAIGAENNAGTSHEWTDFYLKARADLLPKAFDLLADVILNPLLRPEDIEHEKGVIIEEIAMKEDVPMDKVGDNFFELMFGDNPLGRDIAGTAETVSSLKRSDFVRYRNTHYDAKNMVMTVSGGVKEKEVLELADKHFSGLIGAKVELPDKFVEKQSKPRVKLETKKSEQAHLLIGFFGLHRTHADRYVEGVLATILGRGMSSRLFTEVREKRGLAYAVGTSVSRFVDTGVFATYAGVDIKKAEEAIKVILEQKYGLAEGVFPIADDELVKAKEYLKGRMALALEDTLEVNDFYGKQVLFMDNIKNPQAVFNEIDRVTKEDVVRVAKNIFKKSKVNLSIIGPYKNKTKFDKLLE